MKTCNAKFANRICAVAVQGALVAMFTMPAAYAQSAAPAAAEDEVTALTRPTSSVELGIGKVSEGSAKFGEYNGLNKAGGFGVGNFFVRGGDAYSSDDGIRRWALTGTDLGTSSRELGASVADQGQWSATFRFDELYHAITDTFDTPFIGAIGASSFKLPGNFGVINTTAPATASQLVGSRNLSPQQLADLNNNENVGVNRKNTSFGTTYNFDRQWSVQFDYNHLNESGAKIISAASSSAPGSASAALWTSWNGEAPVSLLNPAEYKTDTLNLAVNWVGEQAYFTASYFGSFFTDEVNALNWDSPFVKGKVGGAIITAPAGLAYQQDWMSTAPSSMFNQINVKGGYAITPTTKIAGGASYGRNVQDANYFSDNSVLQTGGSPTTALGGVVINENANVKLTDTSIRDLSLTAGVKYNERLNKSPSNVFLWQDLGGVNRINANAPYSNSKTESELGGSYRLTRSQTLSLSYNNEIIERWCENMAAVVPPPGGSGGSSVAGANCVITPRSNENRLNLGYRFKISGELNANVAYSYGKRNATVDENAITPLYDNGGNAAPGAITGPIKNGAGFVNASNYPGFMSYFDASRKQDTVKAGVNWQPDDALTFSLSGRYNKDNYFESTLGEKNGHSSSINFDASFAYAENAIVSAYATAQRREIYALSGTASNGSASGATVSTGVDNSNNLSGNAAGLVDPSFVYSTQLNDKDVTVGLNFNHKGLLDNKLELTADASLSLGRTGYTVETPYYVAATSATSILGNVVACSSPGELICGSTPDITNRTFQFRLSAQYAVDRHNRLMFRYLYQKENVVDYYYNALQYGYTPSTVMPTNQTAPNYSVNVVAVSYIHTF